MTRVLWVVMKGETEIIRVATKQRADAIAAEIGGFVVRYATED